MKIIVWHHSVLSGERIQDPGFAVDLLASQMRVLTDCGLEKHAEEINLSINGGDNDALTLSCYAPKRAKIHTNPGGQSELTTIRRIKESLSPGCAVLYYHMKGVRYPGNPVWDAWRRCMERVCLWNWTECLQAMRDGFDTAGAHWMCHQKYRMIDPGQQYWGGNFWWASYEYLKHLPPPAPDTHENRYEAEVWIGKIGGRPRVLDFAPHFPMTCKL